MRTKGSCRFADYYKVQVWIPHLLAWQDMQKTHASEPEARMACPDGAKCRVMRVTEKVREIIP